MIPARSSWIRRRAALSLACACCLWVSSAVAAPNKKDQQKADKLFKEALTLMDKGSFDAACPKLEESQKLDPAPPTQFKLAQCYESTNRPATAMALYLEVAELASKAGYKDKEKYARDAAAAVEPKVPRIILEVPAKQRVLGLAVTRDGKPVEESQFDRPILVDPGDFTIEATAPGKKPFKSVVTVKGVGTKVAVPINLEDAAPQTGDKPAPAPKSGYWGPQRFAAIGLGVVGVGGVVVGSVFGMSAKDGYEGAINDKALCPTKKTCYPEGKAKVDAAQTDALISTISFAVGGVALAGGVVLFLLAPSGSPAKPPASTGLRSWTVLPVAAPDYGGLITTGTF